MDTFDNGLFFAIGLNDYCNRYNHQFHESIYTTDMSVECATDLVVTFPYYDVNIVVSPPQPLLKADILDETYLNLLNGWNEVTTEFYDDLQTQFTTDTDPKLFYNSCFGSSYNTPEAKFARKLIDEEESAMHKEAVAYGDSNGYRDYTDMLRNIVKENENGRLPISKSNEAILAVYDKYAYIYSQVEELTQSLIKAMTSNFVDLQGAT